MPHPVWSTGSGSLSLKRNLSILRTLICLSLLKVDDMSYAPSFYHFTIHFRASMLEQLVGTQSFQTQCLDL